MNEQEYDIIIKKDFDKKGQLEVTVRKKLDASGQKYDLYKGYTVIDGFAYSALTHPANIHDAIVVRCKDRSDCLYPRCYHDAPYHDIDDYIEIINKKNIQKAIIILDDISFLNKCSGLKFISITPSYQSGSDFDFSPLYDMPKVLSLHCNSRFGDREQYVSQIDYSKIKGLIDLGIGVTKGTLNYNRLKSLNVTGFKGEYRDLTDLFCSEQLDTLSIIQCGITSLNGIGTSKKMQCLYLHYNRSLTDISALYSVKSTMKALRIENCPQIKDFSVLGELENLELLELSGSNELPSLSFLKSMKKLKTFTFSVNVLDGDLSLCKNLSYVYSEKNRKHYSLKDKDMPKSRYVRGNEDIEMWRRTE